jgi:anti-sigma-K factor RskA
VLSSNLRALAGVLPAHPVPRALRRRVLRAARAEPKVASGRPLRRMRPVRPRVRAGWLALGVTAVVAIAVHLAPARPSERTIRATVGRAQLRVADGQGDFVVDRLPTLPPSRTYQLWLLSRRRGLVPSTLFGVTWRGTADLGVPGNLDGVTRLLVTVEPRGGSPHPTTRPVIQVPLAYVSRS